jgi:catechol 2,3-dioxygenase-like lactoylglutathione lyase family enzyme
MKLNAVRIFVRDIAAARDFYSNQLGLPLASDGSRHGFCVFAAGGADLIVEVVGDDAPQDDQVLVGRFTGVSLEVDDAHETHRRLTAAGVEFTGEPEKQFWGGILATFRDPAGNELQIVEQPAE